MFRVLAWIILIKLTSGSKIYNIPVNCGRLESVKLHEIKCPQRVNELSLQAHHQLAKEEHYNKICRPQLKDDDHLEGFICRKQKWITKCTETWYFSTSIEYQILEVIPEFSGCNDAVKKLDQGALIPPYYPPAGCFWNAEMEQEIEFYILIQHKPFLNPYDNMIYDSRFLKPCTIEDSKKLGCQLKDITGTWVPDIRVKEVSEHCNHQHWECITVKSFKSELNEKERLWEAPDIGLVHINKGCLSKFCGRDGIIFADGEWWSIENKTNEDVQNFEIRECVGKKPGFRMHTDRTEFEELDIKAELEHERCLNTISKILNRENINTLDMSYLAPTRPGRDYAYLFKQTKWQEKLCLSLSSSLGVIKNCSINWKSSTKGGMVKKDHVGIGSYERTMCEYRPFIDENEDGYIEMGELKGHKMSSHHTMLELPPSGGSQNQKINVTLNGMIFVGENKLYLQTKSAYDGIEEYQKLIKFEVQEYDNIEENLIKYEEDEKVESINLTPHENKNVSRTDIVREIQRGGRRVLSAVAGWFTSTAKAVRWTIWAVGAIVTTYAIYKLYKMVKNNSKSKNTEDIEIESLKPQPRKEVRSPKIEKKYQDAEIGLYEEIKSVKSDDKYALESRFFDH
ncbi:virion transmembrane glycoprotein G [Berrimah virus]|uniref:Glycoprotein n=1 Tax=Berrimah virus TaxID=318834 RepID=I3NUX7_9RHAB|nr:virion transmembrane glycoprotein G [Berrimah virus]AEH58019.1 virion transmembrane glycoprotein G [Berrimah virus]AFR60316.1 glycoprotein [Berrimah virus]